MKYCVEVLTNDMTEFNPVFTLNNKEEFIFFVKICLDNGLDITVSAIKDDSKGDKNAN